MHRGASSAPDQSSGQTSRGHRSRSHDSGADPQQSARRDRRGGRGTRGERGCRGGTRRSKPKHHLYKYKYQECSSTGKATFEVAITSSHGRKKTNRFADFESQSPTTRASANHIAITSTQQHDRFDWQKSLSKHCTKSYYAHDNLESRIQSSQRRKNNPEPRDIKPKQ